MKNPAILFFLLLITVVPRDAFAQVYKTESGKAEFLSKAPLNEFTGKSSNLNGLIDLEENVLDFFIDLNTLKTGIGLRDRHMRENYLETKKYPFAEFVGKIKENVAIKTGESKAVTAIGTFKIHGKEKEITVPGKLTAVSPNELKLEATFKILLSDYNIDIPKVVFYELAEEQTISISSNLKK
ncbi:YceI family protein [Belliella marina]|uniref:YceI family protein n=1 Tax=Belliella marina TaxID=1644146 RepID=A0ABW4VQT7_9BACT